MELVSLFCTACFAFGDPTAVIVPNGEGITAHGLAATSFSYRSDAPRDWDAVDGMAIQQGRIGLAGMFHDIWGFYGALAADDTGLSNWELYGDVMPVDGFRIRTGRWLVGLGPVSGRRIEQRAFVDAPLHTERFLGPNGLFDVGLQLKYRVPIALLPIDIEASILRGSGNSFSAPLALGDGASTLERMLYVARLRLYPGAAFGEHLALGLTFATGENGTGPGNRTDLIGADIEGMFTLPSDVHFGVAIEYMLRRRGIPRALEVEGTLSSELTVSWRTLLAGFRADVMGLPTPSPLRDRVEYRFSTAVGYTPTEWIRIRTQYSARNDQTDGALTHEFMLQAIIGLATRFKTNSASKAAGAHHRTIKTDGLVAIKPKPANESGEDWLATSRGEMLSAETLRREKQYATAVLHAQRGALARIRGILTLRGAQGSGSQSKIRSITLAIRALEEEAPPTILQAARRLDRGILNASAPSALGGAPADYFDANSAERAIQDARVIIGWSASL